MTRKIIRRSAAVLTAVLFALPVCAADYRDQFTDVAKTAWYYNDVADAYANGLISGKSDTEFKPDGTLTVAEAVKLAVVCHQTLVSGKVSPLSPSGENWYDPYVTYAKDNGIVTEDEDYTAPATRGKIAVLFSRAMISSGTDCPEVNPIAFGNLSDVDVSAWYSGAVYRLYRWGILTGDGTSVKPESPVKRSEISAVVMRMIDASRRVDLDKTNGEKLPQAPTVTPPADNTPAPGPCVRAFRFSALTRVMDVASLIAMHFEGESTLYKDGRTGGYLLVLKNAMESQEDFDRICNILSEYGTLMRTVPASQSFFAEHYDTVIAGDAVAALGNI